MTGETERTGAEGPGVACRPNTRARMIADGVALAISMSLAGAGVLAALGVPSVATAGTVLTVLFWLWVVGTTRNTASLLARAGIPRNQRKLECDKAGDWPRAILALRLLWRTLLIVLLVYGHYELAALLGYGIALGIASRAENRFILGEKYRVGPVSRAVHWIVFAAAEGLAPAYAPLHRLLARPVRGVPFVAWLVVVPLFPIIVVLAILPLLFWLLYVLLSIPFWLFGFVRDRALEKEMVRAACAEGRLAWFAYSEPHQRERFLGEGGVLHGMGDALIVRNWRSDMDGIGQRDSGADLDAMIANRYNLSNMRDDLPVVVLFQPDGRARPVMLNRAYRQRFRDGGDLLAALEGPIRQKIQALGQPAA